MAKTITINYPASLAKAMRLQEKDFGKEIKESALVKLFERGKITSGTAAEALNISRLEFLDLLDEYEVGFLDVENLKQDLENA